MKRVTELAVLFGIGGARSCRACGPVQDGDPRSATATATATAIRNRNRDRDRDRDRDPRLRLRLPRRDRLWAGLVALLLLAGCAGDPEQRSPAQSRWRKGSGWRATPAQGGRRLSPSVLLQDSREAQDSGQHQDAIRGFLALREHYPDSVEAKAVTTSFLIAECYYNLGEERYEEAYPHYLAVLKANPDAETLKTTLERIHAIGIAFLDGRARRVFLGISYRSPVYGVEILLGAENGLVSSYPFLKLSEDALMKVARHYFDKKEYDQAEEVFDRLIRDYPASEWVEAAEYQQALSVFLQVRGVDYDQEAMRKARSRFSVYLQHNPRGNWVDEARGSLRRISEMEAQHDLQIAKYYLRESQPEAARLYLRAVLFNNPLTDAAREAKEIHDYIQERRGGS